jgi:hypothetical protein
MKVNVSSSILFHSGSTFIRSAGCDVGYDGVVLNDQMTVRDAKRSRARSARLPISCST